MSCHGITVNVSHWAFKGADRKRCGVPYLWSRVPRHQTGELQGLSLPNGVDSLGVSLLLDVAGVS